MSVYLRYWRELHDLTVEQMAERTGFGVDELTKLERKRREPSPEYVQAYSRVLNREPWEIVRDPRRHLVMHLPPAPPKATHRGSKTVN